MQKKKTRLDTPLPSITCGPVCPWHFCCIPETKVSKSSNFQERLETRYHAGKFSRRGPFLGAIFRRTRNHPPSKQHPEKTIHPSVFAVGKFWLWPIWHYFYLLKWTFSRIAKKKQSNKGRSDSWRRLAPTQNAVWRRNCASLIYPPEWHFLWSSGTKGFFFSEGKQPEKMWKKPLHCLPKGKWKQ